MSGTGGEFAPLLLPRFTPYNPVLRVCARLPLKFLASCAASLPVLSLHMKYKLPIEEGKKFYSQHWMYYFKRKACTELYSRCHRGPL